MKTIVSEKGQVTIPKPIRDKLGLVPGTALDFQEDHGRLIGIKKLAEDVFKKWRGKGRLPGNLSVDDYLKMTRDADRR